MAFVVGSLPRGPIHPGCDGFGDGLGVGAVDGEQEGEKNMTVIYCRKCKHPIAFTSMRLGVRIPPEIRKEMKPVNEDGVEKRLCAACEEEEGKKS